MVRYRYRFTFLRQAKLGFDSEEPQRCANRKSEKPTIRITGLMVKNVLPEILMCLFKLLLPIHTLGDCSLLLSLHPFLLMIKLEDIVPFFCMDLQRVV